jgi:cytochrome b561
MLMNQALSPASDSMDLSAFEEKAMSNAIPRYDSLTIVLHWLTALLVVTLYMLAQATGLFAKDAPIRTDIWATHVTLGGVLAVVLAFRIAWRVSGDRGLPAADRGLLHAVAKATHWVIYLLLTAVVLLGLANAWTHGTNMFGLFSIPTYNPSEKALPNVVNYWHNLAAYAILAVAGIHAAAALMHQFVWRDRLLLRMVPHTTD